MAAHSSTLAWKMPWMEEPGGLQSMGSLRVRHDWATSLSLFTFMHWKRKRQPTPVFLPGESRGWGAWWAAIYGVAQSWTRLKWLSSSSSECHTRDGIFGKTMSLPLLHILMWSLYSPLWRRCSTSFQVLPTGNCSIRNCRFVVAVIGHEFRISQCYHFEPPPWNTVFISLYHWHFPTLLYPYDSYFKLGFK